MGHARAGGWGAHTRGAATKCRKATDEAKLFFHQPSHTPNRPFPPACSSSDHAGQGAFCPSQCTTTRRPGHVAWRAPYPVRASPGPPGRGGPAARGRGPAAKRPQCSAAAADLSGWAPAWRPPTPLSTPVPPPPPHSGCSPGAWALGGGGWTVTSPPQGGAPAPASRPRCDLTEPPRPPSPPILTLLSPLPSFTVAQEAHAPPQAQTPSPALQVE